METISWLDIHKRRLVNEGVTIKDSYDKQIENFIEVSFADSPTFLVVTIDGEEYDTRLITEKKYSVASGYETKKLILRPHVKAIVGRVAEFHDKNWLIVFFDDRELEPKAHIRFCNNILKLKGGINLPCVLDNRISDAQKIKEEGFVDLSSDTLKITVGYDSNSKKIKENDRFIINEKAWEVQGVNDSSIYNGEGIIELAVKKVALRDEEQPIELTPIIPRDYFIKIIGNEKVGINSTEQFRVELYIDSVLANVEQESVIWSVDKGSITDEGLFTSPKEKEVATIAVEYQYEDIKEKIQTIKTTKKLEIFDPNDWSWG